VTDHERFRRIEPRRADDPSEVKAADRARIAAVIDAAPPSIERGAMELEVAAEAPAGDGVPIERAVAGQEIAVPPETDGPELSIDTAVVSGQPFVRCARCGADSSIHATSCDNCNAELDTAEQRAFNEKVWDAQRRRDERERAALAGMAEARAEVIRASFRPISGPGMQPPPELLEPIDDGDGPLLVGVIKALQKPKWRWAAGGIIAGLPLLLVTLGGPILSKIGWTLVFLCLLGLLPKSVGRRILEARYGRRRH
jgi:hypothetical protein